MMLDPILKYASWDVVRDLIYVPKVPKGAENATPDGHSLMVADKQHVKRKKTLDKLLITRKCSGV